ncbi:head maturation protease, ClpP-related [Clostridium sp. BNL1100]|uniref:head maturation protease, ClpP-related n=1 Tax=Clostridium sp. BNL1100 TaxID=755731 RepID=UPI00024A7F0E|nr:head maturation protease, ClpP-related [Clostridium sp. BNL1100]AEY65415.1 protease subunit of ATP-dependent protease [Clostridium sp. BNL1100]
MPKLELLNKDKRTGKEKVCGNLEIKNQSNDLSELFIYGDIMNYKWDESDVIPQDIADFLKELDGKSKLNIYINSGGGSVFAGLAIYNQLKRHTAEKTVYVDGVAASIASVIAMCGQRLIIPSNAFLMIHKAWSLSVGNANDFRKAAEDLERIDEGILNIYKENLADGVDIETIKELVNSETWLTGEEASKYFNIEVVEESKAAACASDYFSKYKNSPKVFNTQQKHNQREEIEKQKLLLEIDLI